MDPALLRQSQDYRKHAMRNVSVQQRPASSSNSHTTYNAEAAKKKKKASASSLLPKTNSHTDFDYRTAVSHSNSAAFSVMAKIVDYMKKRHLNNQHWGLTLQEILDEIQAFDVNKKALAWLEEALPKNPRLQVTADNKFIFNPPYKIKGKSSLVSVAKKHYEDGKGGILLSELNECIPNGEKILEDLSKEIIVIQTQVNKRKDKVFYYNDPEIDFDLEDDFKGLWRNVSVDHLDEKKIEEYLQKHGIDVMKDLAPKKFGGPPKRKAPKRRFNGKVHNEHLTDVLQDYT